MSEYNNLFDFNAPQLGFDAVDSEYPALPPDLDQSAAWTAPLQSSVGMMEGDTAALLQLDVDSAPSMGVETIGIHLASHLASHGNSVDNHTCVVCFEPYQTDSALHQHAIEAQHKSYQCKCGTSFNKHSALKRHVETKDAPKNFACVLCRDKFTRKDKLKDHWHHFHKVSVEGLRFLSDSQGLKPQPGAPSRRCRVPTQKAAASSGTSAPALPPALAPAPAGESVWSCTSSTGGQDPGLPAGPFVPASQPATTSAFVSVSRSVTTGQSAASADAFAAVPALGVDFSGTLDTVFGDETWAAGFDNFAF